MSKPLTRLAIQSASVRLQISLIIHEPPTFTSLVRCPFRSLRSLHYRPVVQITNGRDLEQVYVLDRSLPYPTPCTTSETLGVRSRTRRPLAFLLENEKNTPEYVPTLGALRDSSVPKGSHFLISHLRSHKHPCRVKMPIEN